MQFPPDVFIFCEVSLHGVKEMPRRIGFEISSNDRALVEEVCATRGEAISSFMRRVVKRELVRLGYLGDDVKRALGE